ncbi:dTMP kinase [Halanaerobacter jeridensis]|uniref:Thymidylate kinase n=1 Tax=Halanaerobacter jeridensis TaxID=706427 RepID=A0A939BRD5_9FIRM|nr:dTMP kinase [Halanaerobacter jeridensis]MBM7557244.1 dTMP kinase [Halanaerobacter jeridensis]
MHGKFITLEGVEGSGKSTQLQLVKNYLQDLGYQVIMTYEPGDTEVGNKIRQILLDPKYDKLVPKAELMLYLADRAQHVQEVIIPNLKDGKIVISDRYIDATWAYQGFARELDSSVVKKLNSIATDNLTPDLTLLLDLDPAVSLQRAKETTAKTNEAGDRIEAEKIEFHQQVRKGYLELAEQEERIAVVDGNKAKKEVFGQIKQILKERSIVCPE